VPVVVCSVFVDDYTSKKDGRLIYIAENNGNTFKYKQLQ
jgi:hypothetical protein